MRTGVPAAVSSVGGLLGADADARPVLVRRAFRDDRQRQGRRPTRRAAPASGALAARPCRPCCRSPPARRSPGRWRRSRQPGAFFASFRCPPDSRAAAPRGTIMAQPCPPAASHDRRPLPNGDRFRRGFVLALVIGITAAFLWMVWAFVKTVVLAAILAGLFHPLYRRLYARVGERGWLAAHDHGALIVLFVIVVPLALVLGLVASEALRLSTAVAPRVRSSSPTPTSCRRCSSTAALLRAHRAVSGPDPGARRRAGRQPRALRRLLDLGHDRRHRLGDPAVLHPALHAVLPAHRRPGAAAQDDQLPAAARGREGGRCSASSCR